MTDQPYRTGGHSPINIWWDPDRDPDSDTKTGMQIATAQGGTWARVLVNAANFYSARQHDLLTASIHVLQQLPELVEQRIAELGISKRQAAAAIGMPNSLLSRWPTGERGLSLISIVKILTWLRDSNPNARPVEPQPADPQVLGVRHSPLGELQPAVAVRVKPGSDYGWVVVEEDLGLVSAKSDDEVSGWPLMRLVTDQEEGPR